MKAFLAVAWQPGVAIRFRRPDPRVLACLTDDDTPVGAVHAAENGWTACAGPDAGDSIVGDDGSFTIRIGRMARTPERDVPTSDLPAMIMDGRDLTSMLPPFAAVHRAHRSAPLTIVSDWLGFHQLFWWRGNGVVAASTSARALAALADAGFDAVGLGVQAMIGWQIGDHTMFRGVRTFPPATVATLDGGRIVQRQYADPPAAAARTPNLDDAVAEMASVLRGWQQSYLSDHPDAVLQLTGGHDSRILLAATPQQMRAGLNALTLGDPDSDDAEIAARLAAPFQMNHVVHRLDEQAWPTPQGAHDLSLAAARALHCQASPLALVPLLLAEAHLDQGHRLSGLGGEVARGFYYAGQPRRARTTGQLIERLANWRLFSNESVEAQALDSTFLASARDTTIAALKSLFAPGDWLRATDEFYLMHRMHRWAGAHGTVAAVRRHYVNPMFDRRFVELALGVAPRDKRDSLLLGRLMKELDPKLARIPLDSGLSPARLGTRSVVTTLATQTLAARKVTLKVSQRLTRARRPQLGAAEAAALVLTHWRAEPKTCQALYDVTSDGAPVLQPRWLDDVLSGGRHAQPTTVAFLVDLLAATT
ncbi:hypothetical protein [Micromonospora sp. DT47]|uniref:hypothetical protein n=1 Tax=Micromonospora sp. DT47 TaxID=3393431 RepID=UPI003CEF21C6